MWNWIDWEKKQIAVQTEKFLHGIIPEFRLRQTAVMSLIRLKSSPRTKATNNALVFSAGFAKDDRPINIEGGHLIGIKLGGIDDDENVVPMYSHVNRMKFLSVEHAIAQAYRPGQKMGLVVLISYPSAPADGRIPDGFSVQLYRDMEMDPLSPGRFTGTALGPPSIIDAAPQLSARKVLDPHVQLHLDLAKAAVARGWTIEQSAPETRDWVARGKLPPVGKRPYAHLDYLAAHDPANVLFPIPYDSVGGGWPFSAQQRQVIQNANRYGQIGGRAGECWTDDPADPHQCALIEIGTDTGFEIDHIMPMRPSGSNAFSNAQLISAGYNRSKSNSV